MRFSFDSIGYGKREILTNLDYTFEPGTIIGLVAPNGVGKSTLFKGIMNRTSLLQGSVNVQGHEFNYPLDLDDEVVLYQYVSLMVDSDHLIPYISGYDHLTFAKQNWNSTQNIEQIIELLEIDSYVNDKVSTYSLGMRQRLCFAMQQIMDTPVMLMDEVMNSLDIVNVDLISRILVDMKKKGKIIMIASHLLDNLNLYADDVLFLKDTNNHFLFSGNSDEKIITIYSTDRQKVLDIFKETDLFEPFQNKFQIPRDKVSDELLLSLLGAHSVREITMGDKSIVDYYHELYL